MTLTVALLLLTSNRGFGLTDESFYVAWIDDPSRYDVSITPFGPPLHLLFVSFGRSIIALRVFGVGLLLASGAILGASLGRYYSRSGLYCSSWALAGLGALFSLSYYAIWILTPSYNLLANVGAALVFAGALEWAGADRGEDGRGYAIGATLIGIGGCIAFFGKPTLAALAGIAVALMIARTAWRNGPVSIVVPSLIAALVAILPLLAAVQASVGIDVFVRSIVAGTAILDFGNALSAIPVKFLGELLQMRVLLAMATVTLVALAWSWRRSPLLHEHSHLRKVVAAVFLLFLLYSAALIALGVHDGGDVWAFIGPPIACAALALIGLGAVAGGRPVPRLTMLIPLAVLLAIPLATALGSANLLLFQIGMSTYAFLLTAVVAGVVFFTPRTARRVAATAALSTVFIVVCSATRPYSLTGPISAETEPVALPFTRDTLLVARETRDYVTGLRRLAIAGGIDDQVPVIDLSAGGPGTVLLLDGKAPLYPWLLPGTRKPGALADHAWSALNIGQQRRTWIVGPVQPAFGRTKLAAFLSRNQACYRHAASYRKHFWDGVKHIQFWAPISDCRWAYRRGGQPAISRINRSLN